MGCLTNALQVPNSIGQNPYMFFFFLDVFLGCFVTSDLATVTLPETNSEFTPENRPLGSLESPDLETIIFGGELLISGEGV